MRNFVCLDIDGTYLNFTEGLQRYLLDTHGLHFDPSKCTDYNFNYPELGFDRQIIFNSFSDPKLYDYIKPFHNAFESVQQLLKFVDIKAYTCVFNNPEVIKKRYQLCDSLCITPNVYLGNEKPVIAGADAVFDDCLEVFDNWLKYDTDTMLFIIDAPYNRKINQSDSSLDYNRLIRCKNLEEAIDIYIDSIHFKGKKVG